MTPIAASCTNHPSREAVGVCVRCRTRICAECVTKVDGINHCVACFSELVDEHERPAAPHRVGEVAWKSALRAAGYLVVLSGLTWLLLTVALPGPGGP